MLKVMIAVLLLAPIGAKADEAIVRRCDPGLRSTLRKITDRRNIIIENCRQDGQKIACGGWANGDERPTIDYAFAVWTDSCKLALFKDTTDE